MDIELPEGLSITADESGKLNVSFGADCAAASHTITAAKVAGNNRYRIVAFSSSNEVFKNGEGLLNIAIASAQTLSGGDIKVEDIVLSLSGTQSFEAEPLLITVPSVTAVDNIKITPSTADVNLGSTLRLTAEVSPSTASVQTVTWTSLNENIATVDADGNVTPVAKGQAIITATVTSGEAISANILSVDRRGNSRNSGAFTTQMYNGSVGIDNIINDSAISGDIYNLQGICLKRNATEEDVKALHPGVYIINGKKVLVK